MQRICESRCVFDREVALHGFGHNEDGLREALRSSWPQALQMVARVREAAAQKDLEGLLQAVHWLRSGMIYIGAFQAGDAVKGVASDFALGLPLEGSLTYLEESLQRLHSALTEGGLL
jgi:hypothetical protein